MGLVLTGCAASKISGKDAPKIQTVSAGLAKPCRAPTELPKDTDLTEVETTKLWGADRVSLAECSRKHKAVVAYTNTLVKGLNK